MQKTKRITLLSLIAILLMLTFFGAFGAVKASAANVNTTPSYTLSNMYYNGTSMVGGAPSEFSVIMHSTAANGTGTLYNNAITNFAKYVIKVQPHDIRSHKSYKLFKNGALYLYDENLSGNQEITLIDRWLADGTYELQYTANVGNFFVNKDYIFYYTFQVDNSVPFTLLTAGGMSVNNGEYTNKAITFTASDANFQYIYYKKPGANSYTSSGQTTYSVTATASNNGLWSFYAMDKKNQTSQTVSVYLDTVAPVGTVTNVMGSTVPSGSYFNGNFKYNVSDTGGVSYCQIMKPGTNSWTSYNANSWAADGYGQYKFRAVDKADNVSAEYYIYFDPQKPDATLYAGSYAVENYSTVNAPYIKFDVSDQHSGISGAYVKMPGSTEYTAYASGTQLSTEGSYAFYAVDRCGNSTYTYYITLDNTAPVGAIYSGDKIVPSGSITNVDSIRYEVKDNISLWSIYCKSPTSDDYKLYENGTELFDEGKYTFYAVDQTGNESDFLTVTVDRQIPKATLYIDNNPIDSGKYTNGGYVRFECDEKCYVKLPGAEEFTDYISGYEFSKPGKYVFYGISEAGNSSGYYSVVIDRESIEVELINVSGGKTDGDVVITWDDGDADVNAPVASITINGIAYTKGSTIYTIREGVYNVVVTDAAGNVSTFEFTSQKKNIETDTLNQKYYEVFDKDGNYFSFATYESALEFAKAREYTFVRQGEWKSDIWDAGIQMDSKDSINAVNGIYYIYKKSGNPDVEVAYFTLERLSEVMTEYGEIGIKSYYYFEKEPAPTAEGENLYAAYDNKNIISHSVNLEDNINVSLDGEVFEGKVIESEGIYLMTVSDDWGNTCEYTLAVVRKAPNIQYSYGGGANNTVTYDRTYYFSENVNISISDPYDTMAMFSVFDGEGKLIGTYYLEDIFTIDCSGSYTIVAVNHAGKTQKFNLVVSLSAPEIEMIDDAEKKKLTITVNGSEDEHSNISMIEIYISKDDGATWELLREDDYGNIISTDTLTYTFARSGIYRVVVSDEFRTGLNAVTLELNYVQLNPVGILGGVSDGGYTNGAVTFVWFDEATVTLTKDDELIDYVNGTEITEDGAYTVAIENIDGFKQLFVFTIDTEAPTVTIEGGTHRESVNNDVKVFFFEENLEAELFKNGKSLGEYVSGTPVSADGIYRIIVKDRARNMTEVEFTIDKKVDYAINVNNNGLSNSVIATANELVDVSLLKNGEVLEYVLGSAITEPAKYVLSLTDHIGNTVTCSFEVINPMSKGFSHNFDDVEGFAGVLVNGEEKHLNYGTLELFEDGKYEVAVIVSGNKYLFNITVDNTAPTVTIEGVEIGGETDEAVIITGISEQAEFILTKNGNAARYILGEAITEAGAYTVTVTDVCGNSASYDFVIKDKVNIAAIAVGSVLGVGAIGGGVVWFIKKKRSV